MVPIQSSPHRCQVYAETTRRSLDESKDLLEKVLDRIFAANRAAERAQLALAESRKLLDELKLRGLA